VTRTLNKANRLKEIEKLLALKAYRVAELAERFGVTRRTIERDLWDLREVAELVEDDGSYRLPSRGSALNEVEALAVHSATRLLVHTGVGEPHYRSALRKLAAQLPEPARSALASSVDRLPTSRHDRTLDLVAQAWFNRRVLRCEYRAARGSQHYPHEYEILYYELNRRNLQPYVVARERLYFEGVGVFRLSRMRNVRLLDDVHDLAEVPQVALDRTPGHAEPLGQLGHAVGLERQQLLQLLEPAGLVQVARHPTAAYPRAASTQRGLVRAFAVGAPSCPTVRLSRARASQ
jgi:predicted DNA-binding transcriptional regulator YafY